MLLEQLREELDVARYKNVFESRGRREVAVEKGKHLINLKSSVRLCVQRNIDNALIGSIVFSPPVI